MESMMVEEGGRKLEVTTVGDDDEAKPGEEDE